MKENTANRMLVEMTVVFICPAAFPLMDPELLSIKMVEMSWVTIEKSGINRARLNASSGLLYRFMLPILISRSLILASSSP